MSVAELLTVLQLADSAFPGGRYTLSHGLEGYQQAGAIAPDDLPELLAGLLRHGAGPSDGTALALAHAATGAGDLAAVSTVDRRLYATKLGRPARQASVRTGRALLDLAGEVFGTEALARYAATRPVGCQPVVAGVLHASVGTPAEAAVAGELFAFAASFAGAAVRLRLTDHRRAQVLLRGAAPVLAEATAAALARSLAGLGAGTPMVDVMSGRHERAEARLFAS